MLRAFTAEEAVKDGRKNNQETGAEDGSDVEIIAEDLSNVEIFTAEAGDTEVVAEDTAMWK